VGRPEKVLQALDASAIRRWAAVCVRSLDVQREVIDSINVYPVADGDTGSNLLSTMRSALAALLRAPLAERSAAGAAMSVLARAALTGARGNSGVICSQALRGFAEVMRDAEEVSAEEVADALVRAAELASTAVAEPVRGTMITVLEAAAEAAMAARSAPGCPGTLHEVCLAAARAAAEALAETPRQLGALAEAGVVDAGGRGLVVVLDALVTVVGEHDEPAPPVEVRAPETSSVTAREAGSEEYGYEVMYLLDSVPATAERSIVDELARKLGRLGDCVSVAGDGSGLWTVHVHCNDIGAAIELGVEAGRPHRITVARFADEVERTPHRFRGERVVVVPVHGGGLAALFRDEGAVVLELAEADDPDVWDLLNLITSTGAAHVTVLPGGEELTAVADEAATRAVAAGQDVVVVPCASPVQAMAALAVHDRARRAGDDVVAMAEAAAATRRGAVSVAQEDAITWIGSCRADDVLGFADGEVVLIERGPAGPDTLAKVARGVVERMLAAGGELVTVILGAAAPGDLGESLTEFLRGEHPEVEVSVFHGGGHRDAVLLGVE
jgi:DAK2 domain fusion protein YloV